MIESRFAEERAERLPAVAGELAGLKLDVIVAISAPAVQALRRAGMTIPMVVGMSGDPVEAGFVASHMMPGNSDLTEVYASIVRDRADAIVMIPGPLTNLNRKQIADFALKARLPMIAGWSEHAEAGALVSYGPSRRDVSRRLAFFVDKILRGEKAGDLPVERPTQFQLALNLKTAKALGLTIPPSLLLQADQVIE